MRVVGCELDDHFKAPLKSVLAAGSEAEIDETCKTKATLSSFGVLSLCLWGGVHRNKGSREQFSDCFRSILGACLPGVSVDDLPWLSWIDQLRGHCDSNERDGVCCHLQELKVFDDMQNRSKCLIDVLHKSMFYSCVCKSCALFTNSVLEACSEGIYSEWDCQGFSTNTLRDAPLQEGAVSGGHGSLFLNTPSNV